MTEYELDNIDRGILYTLQEDARHITTEEMGERVGVSASTVGNRISKMEEAGVIRSYHPEIDYEKAGYQLHVTFGCTADSETRSQVTEQALEVSGVVGTNELLGGEENVFVEAIAENSAALARIHDEIDILPLTVHQTYFHRRQYVQPFDHFGKSSTTD